MSSREDFVARSIAYAIAGLTMGIGAGLQWGLPFFLLTVGMVLLLWCLMVDLRVLKL